MPEFVDDLDPAERTAVELVKTALDIYNSRDGSGLFKGMERYQVLAARVELAAIQARNPLELWGLIMRRLQWPPPAQKYDQVILGILDRPEAREAMRILAGNASAIIMLARHWHAAERPKAEKQVAPEETTGGLFE